MAWARIDCDLRELVVRGRGFDTARAASRELRELVDLAAVDALADALADGGVTRIVTSSFVRCRETVEPLARRLGIEVDESEALVEGAGFRDAVDLIEKLAGESAVLCSHGDVLGGVLRHFDRHGVALDGDRLEKASTWVLDSEDAKVCRARYVPPPSI